MTQNWEECLICQRVVLPSRGISTGWRNLQTGTSGNSARRNVKPAPEENQPQALVYAGATQLDRKDLVVLVDTKLNMKLAICLCVKKARSVLGWIRKSLPREVILPL